MFHYTFARHERQITVADGDRLRVVCADADNRLADGRLIPPDRRRLGDPPSPIEGNPVGGPIALADAVAGDALVVAIEDVQLNSDIGCTLLDDDHGLLMREDLRAAAPRHMYQWHIDTQAGFATSVNPLGAHPIRLPLRPMVGCIGVCPASGQSFSTIDAGGHGGNLDLPMLRPGCTAILPVWVDGGLLMLGDIHAAQGHGEVMGGGIETTGLVDMRLGRRAGMAIQSPVLVDKTHVAAAHTAASAEEAIRGAYGALLQLLTAVMSLHRWDSYALISQTATVELGRCTRVSPTGGASFTVAAKISRRDLPADARRAAENWLNI